MTFFYAWLDFQNIALTMIIQSTAHLKIHLRCKYLFRSYLIILFFFFNFCTTVTNSAALDQLSEYKNLDVRYLHYQRYSKTFNTNVHTLTALISLYINKKFGQIYTPHTRPCQTPIASLDSDYYPHISPSFQGSETNEIWVIEPI